MSLEKIRGQLARHVAELKQKGIAKGDEKVIAGLQAAQRGFSERYFLEGFGDRAFLRMNSNCYLGLSLHPRLIEAEARGAWRRGVWHRARCGSLYQWNLFTAY